MTTSRIWKICENEFHLRGDYFRKMIFLRRKGGGEVKRLAIKWKLTKNLMQLKKVQEDWISPSMWAWGVAISWWRKIIGGYKKLLFTHRAVKRDQFLFITIFWYIFIFKKATLGVWNFSNTPHVVQHTSRS